MQTIKVNELQGTLKRYVLLSMYELEKGNSIVTSHNGHNLEIKATNRKCEAVTIKFI